MEWKLQSWMISLLLLVSTAYSMVSLDNTNFSITNFNTDAAKLRIQGDSSIGAGVLQLTTNQRDMPSNYSTGWALYAQQLHLWDNQTNNLAHFTTSFSFSISSENRSSFADGMAFFLTDQQHILSKSTGGNLGILLDGYVNSTTNSPSSFVAVEFDTFENPQFDPKGVGPHIGIDINSINSVTTDPWAWNNIRQGGLVHALITYNASTMNLSALLTDDTSSNSSIVSAIVNLKELLPQWVYFGFSGATGRLFELHKINSWNFSSSLEVATPIAETNQTTPTGGGGNGNNTWKWIVASLSGFVLVSAAAVAAWFCTKKRSRLSQNEFEEEDEDEDLPMDEELERVAAGPKKFTYKDLVQATDNFANEKLLGEGGFGKVYEGWLASIGSRVAIKKITPESSQGFKEYAAEVKAVSQLRHRNLVQLTGWCHRKKELLLIYEYMSNGSLDAHLFKGRTLLTWEIRYRIVQDLAAALLYLHEEWEQCVVHRDIKVSNIMLDSSFNAKLGDFGLARLTDHGKGSQTTVLAGTMGYMAPECLYTGRASKESDVYSFGVVLLEVACGRKVIEPRDEHGHIRLVDWVWELYGTGNLVDAVDPKLGGDMERAQVERMMVVGLWCAHPDSLLRPPIREAFSSLKFDLVPPALPSKMPVPMYSAPPPNMSLSFSSPYSLNGNGTHSYTTESSTTFTSSSKASASSASALLLSSN